MLPVERLVASQGAQAKAKDSQAAVKVLEGQVATYTVGLVSLPTQAGDSTTGNLADPTTATTVPEHMTFGHKGVLEIIAKSGHSSAGRDLIRLDCASAELASAELVASAVFSAMQQARGGIIGWLSHSSVSAEESFDNKSQLEINAIGSKECVQEVLHECFPSFHDKPRTSSVTDEVSRLGTEKLETLKARSLKVRLFSLLISECFFLPTLYFICCFY